MFDIDYTRLQWCSLILIPAFILHDLCISRNKGHSSGKGFTECSCEIQQLTVVVQITLFITIHYVSRTEL